MTPKNSKPPTPIEDFSEAYYLLPEIDARAYSGERVGASMELVQDLAQVVGNPLVAIDGQHHWLKPEWGIPSDTIAVPKRHDHDESEEVLMARRNVAKQMVETGVVPEP